MILDNNRTYVVKTLYQLETDMSFSASFEVGAMNMKQRNASLSAFKSGEARILLMSTKAGNVNLTEARNVILVEPWWNPFVDDQAMDRVHRIGQEKTVRIYKIVCRETIEARILQLQGMKKRMFADIFSGGSSSRAGQKLGEDDIRMLFNIRN